MARRANTVLALSLWGLGAVAWANPCVDKFWLDKTALLARGDGRGIGGTGRGDEGSGIGGTGRSDERGIGGTGHSAPAPGDVALVGVIAGFGSICVNGQEIHYSPATPVRHALGELSAEGLQLGQVVAVRAAPVADRQYQAAEMHLLYAVQGPVEQVDAAQSRVQILGQTVWVPGLDVSAWAVGSHWQVSGKRRADGSIAATAVQAVPASERVWLSGPVQAVTAQGFAIGAQMIAVDGLARPAVGQEVRVQAELRAGQVYAKTLDMQPFPAFSAPVRHLLWQGYVRTVTAGQVNVDGLLFTLGADKQGEWAQGARVSISASLGADGRAQVERWTMQAAPAEWGSALGRPSEGSNRGPESGSSERPLERPLERGSDKDVLLRAESVQTVTVPDKPRALMMRPDMVKPEWLRPDGLRPEFNRGGMERPPRPDIPRPGR